MRVDRRSRISWQKGAALVLLRAVGTRKSELISVSVASDSSTTELPGPSGKQAEQSAFRRG